MNARVKPMVVHCISKLFPYGGTSPMLQAWVRWSDCAHTFVLYEDDADDPVGDAGKRKSEFLTDGARIVPIGRGSLPGQIGAIRTMAKRAGRPVALVGHYFRGSLLACLAGALCGAPAIIVLHSPACLMTPSKMGVHRLLSLQAAEVVYNSEYTAQSFASVRCRRSRIVYSGIDQNDAPVKSGLERGGVVRLVAIGGLIALKNHATLIAMMSLLPETFHLTIMGDGPDRSHLEALARRFGVHGRVAFSGYVYDAARLLRSFDILLHPSLIESFGIVVLEGLLTRIPVVVTDTCSTKEVVGLGAYGSIADARDPRSWADAVVRIASDPEGAWKRCLAAREWALARFSGAEYARRMDEVVHLALDEARARR